MKQGGIGRGGVLLLLDVGGCCRFKNVVVKGAVGEGLLENIFYEQYDCELRIVVANGVGEDFGGYYSYRR